MTMSRSSICNFFSEEIPHLLWHEKKMNVQNKTKVSEEKNLRCAFRNSFLFWTNKKKVSHYERNFLLFLPIKCWSNIFWLFWRFICWWLNVFFCLFKTRKNFENSIRGFFLYELFSCFEHSFFFSCPRGWGRISSEKSCKLTIGTSSFCRYVFPEEWYEKTKWFFLSAKLMQAFSIFIYCAKSQKKSLFWKKLVFPSISLFSRTAFKS